MESYSWRSRLGFRDALAWTTDRERRMHPDADALMVTFGQVAAVEGLE